MNEETFETIKIRLKEWRGQALTQLHNLSQRERMALAALSAFAAVVVIFSAYGPIRAAFARQAAHLEETTEDMRLVTVALDTHFKLKRKKEIIENLYKQVEMEEGVRTLLADTIESKAGIPSGQYEINSRDVRQFGADYEETPFSIRFTTVDYVRLVSFLTELVYGPKPFILIRLDIARRRGASDPSLDVNLDVSAIRRTK